MKEQDAAHSFDKETCPTCGNTWGDEKGKFCSNSWHLATPKIMQQLTRLRSELQQVTQEKESMHIIHCRMLETREKTISKLASELQQAKQEIARIVLQSKTD